MKETLEKLFFAIVRIIFFAIALSALVVLIGSGVYLTKLYYDSFPKPIQRESYLPKDPNIGFGSFETFADKILSQEKARKEHIRLYVVNVIQHGSNGHGYEIKNMPAKLISVSDANRTAIYIANDLNGERPEAFRACAACHGERGDGQNGQSPSLHTLLIYHNIRMRVDNGNATKQDHANYPETQRSAFDKYIDRLMLSLNKYASKTAQPGAERSIIVGYVQNETGKYDAKTEILFKQQLESGLKNLDTYAKKYHAYADNSPLVIPPLQWKRYLEWFAEYFYQHVSAEKEKVAEAEARNTEQEAQARAKASNAKDNLTPALTIAGGLLIVFILATMLLILIRIEYNTRHTHDKKEEA